MKKINNQKKITSKFYFRRIKIYSIVENKLNQVLLSYRVIPTTNMLFLNKNKDIQNTLKMNKNVTTIYNLK